MQEPVQIIAGRYVLHELLGHGGMGRVYRVRDTVLGRDVAVKVLTGSDAQDVVRFQTEARLLSALSHPGIVVAYDAGTDASVSYLVMELVPGASLAHLLSSEGALPPTAVAALGAHIADALAAVHAAGVVHRDIKPANVVMDDAGRPRLTDFGVARLVSGTRHTGTGLVIGTAAYLAPEQVAGEAVGAPADIYALGLVLLEALSGAPAFTGSGVEVAIVRLTRRPAIPSGLPGGWTVLLEAITRREPGSRPGAAAVAEALRALAEPQPDLAATVPLPSAIPVNAAPSRPPPTAILAASRTTLLPTTGPPRRRRRLLATGLVSLAAVLVIVAGLALQQTHGTGHRIDAPAPGSTVPDPAATPLSSVSVAPAATSAPPATSTPAGVGAGPTTAAVQTTAASATSPAPPRPGKPAPGHGKGKGKHGGQASGDGG